MKIIKPKGHEIISVIIGILFGGLIADGIVLISGANNFIVWIIIYTIFYFLFYCKFENYFKHQDFNKKVNVEDIKWS